MFRRGGQRDDRRRRVLTEELVGRGRDVSSSSADQQKCEGASYAPEAALDKHLRLSDLVPRRLWGIGLFTLSGASVIAGILALYQYMQPWQSTSGQGRQVFDLMASGSLASWTASVMLLTVSLASFIVLSMRRHKMNDYKGRYRIWAWTAVAALAMSAAATAPYHLVAAEALAGLTLWQVPGGTATFWMTPTLLFLGVLAVRLLLDMRDSVIASFALVASVLAYGGALGTEMSGPALLVDPHTIMVLAGCKLAGHLLLLVSVLLFARHVLRDIQGLVVVRKSRRKDGKKQESDDEDSGADGRAIHKAHRNPPAPKGISDLETETPSKRNERRRRAAELVQDEYEEEDERPSRRGKMGRQRHQEVDDYDDYDDEPATNGRKLTKSQRKKLRKLKAQQRQTGI